MIAIIRLRGSIKMDMEMRDTLKLLNLERVNALSLVENTPSNAGMIRKASSFITWGEASEETKRLLEGKRCIGLKPRKGGIRSVKKRYPQGSLGYRGEKINELVKEMV